MGEFHLFLRGGILMWVNLFFIVIKLKYVGCECIRYLWVAFYLGEGWLFMLIMVENRFSSWCRYFGHFVVGLYCMVLGEMVAIMCSSVQGDGDGVPFMVDYEDGCGVVVLLGCHAGPMDGCHGILRCGGGLCHYLSILMSVNPIEPNIMSRLCGELY